MDSISESIKNHIISSKDYDSSDVVERKYYVSDMGKCERTRWLKRKGIKQTFDPHVYWILQMGDLIHDFVYEALEAQKRLIEVEVTVENNQFKGRLDAVVRFDDREVISDIKSANPWKIKKIMGGDPDAWTRDQLLTYCLMRNMEEGSDKYDRGLAIYINKDPNAKSTLEVVYEKEHILTPSRKKKLLAEMNKMTEYWVNDEIPPCTCPGWMAPYNNFLPLCKMPENDIRYLLGLIEEGKTVISSKDKIMLASNYKQPDEEISEFLKA